jgi:hypothetical protein
MLGELNKSIKELSRPTANNPPIEICQTPSHNNNNNSDGNGSINNNNNNNNNSSSSSVDKPFVSPYFNRISGETQDANNDEVGTAENKDLTKYILLNRNRKSILSSKALSNPNVTTIYQAKEVTHKITDLTIPSIVKAVDIYESHNAAEPNSKITIKKMLSQNIVDKFTSLTDKTKFAEMSDELVITYLYKWSCPLTINETIKILQNIKFPNFEEIRKYDKLNQFPKYGDSSKSYIKIFMEIYSIIKFTNNKVLPPFTQTFRTYSGKYEANPTTLQQIFVDSFPTMLAINMLQTGRVVVPEQYKPSNTDYIDGFMIAFLDALEILLNTTKSNTDNVEFILQSYAYNNKYKIITDNKNTKYDYYSKTNQNKQNNNHSKLTPNRFNNLEYDDSLLMTEEEFNNLQLDDNFDEIEENDDNVEINAIQNKDQKEKQPCRNIVLTGICNYSDDACVFNHNSKVCDDE